MPKRLWAEEAIEQLQAGRVVQIHPAGHSMTGRVSDGDLVTLQPCLPEDLAAGDVVLARVQGRRSSHLVLHLVIKCETDRFLIGNNHGRIDGWVSAQNIFGKLRQVEPAISE